MFDTVTQEFRLVIGDVCIRNSDRDWANDFKKQIADEGFTMTNGLMITVSLRDLKQKNPVAFCSVPVARRLSPLKTKPETRHDAQRPEFMEYYAFSDQKSGFGWGSHIINELIGNNWGKLPAEWVAATIPDES